MLSSLQRSACAACRLRQNIAAKQLARTKWPLPLLGNQTAAARRGFTASAVAAQRNRRVASSKKRAESQEVNDSNKPQDGEEEDGDLQDLEGDLEAMGISEEQERLSRLLFLASLKVGMDTQRLVDLVADLQKDGSSVEERALKVREAFGDLLPEGLLGEEEERVYLMLYGEPVRRLREVDLEAIEEEVVSELEGEDGDLEGEGTGVERMGREGQYEEVEFEDEDRLVQEKDGDDSVDPATANARLYEDMRQSMGREEELEENDDEENDPTLRAHPLTVEGRFSTSPSSVQLPKATFVQPIDLLLTGTPHTHIKDAAHRVFGGIGLPNSTSTPSLAKTMQQKPIPIDATQGRMTDIDANTFLAVLMPAMYSTVMSALVESRKRLGTAWAESLVRKAEAGELKILDAGGAGAGVLAVRDMLKAEWERMHEDDVEASSGMSLAEADGKLGGAGLTAPLGNATVLTGSDALRKRASALLENTTFIPRLPDYFHTETAKESGKFDLVIAPHTLFRIREDWARKDHVDNLWSLASSEGGLLIMLEKGMSRGFEAIALAREHILNTHIAEPESKDQMMEETTDEAKEEIKDVLIEDEEVDPDEPDIIWDGDEPAKSTKERGMIVAPCTNHSECPMYSGKNKGPIKGRKDICHFEQRFTRPPFLQKVLGAKDKNFEDLKFSYVALMRGRDLRVPQPERTDAVAFASQPTVVQGDEATDRAFEGYEVLDPDSQPNPSSLSLPRQIMPPLKRRGHVILDLCTPAGSLERWTVPRSFSKRAFRDARKSSWGDLWALGAKTRVLKTARVGDKKHRDRKAEKAGDEEAPERKPLSKRLEKEKRRVKERKAGRKGEFWNRDDAE
jgi:ribosomal protein RSM22 (predicted rRNA methylase)